VSCQKQAIHHLVVYLFGRLQQTTPQHTNTVHSEGARRRGRSEGKKKLSFSNQDFKSFLCEMFNSIPRHCQLVTRSPVVVFPIGDGSFAPKAIHTTASFEGHHFQFFQKPNMVPFPTRGFLFHFTSMHQLMSLLSYKNKGLPVSLWSVRGA
jgi:hypothetical protein